MLVNQDPTIEHLTIDGERLETTPEHPFFTEEAGWVAAGELKSGQHIRKAAGSWGEVQQVQVVEQARTMYNLTVEKAHTFFVGDKQWLVHNVCFDIFGGTNSQHEGAINVDLRSDIQKGIRADATRLPFADNVADEIIITGPHLDNDYAAAQAAAQGITKREFYQNFTTDYLTEASRVLKPEGKIYLNTAFSNPYGFRNFFNKDHSLRDTGHTVLQTTGLRIENGPTLMGETSRFADLNLGFYHTTGQPQEGTIYTVVFGKR